MRIISFTLGPLANKTYLLTRDDTSKAFLIDAPIGIADQCNKVASQYHIDGVFLTHGHWDHIAEASFFAEKGIPIYAGKADSFFFQSSEYFPPQLNIRPFKITPVAEGPWSCLNTSCEIFELPGHSPGGLGLWIPSLQVFFSGDTLFRETIGRDDLPLGDYSTLKKSLDKLKNLPEETIVYPGHGQKTTIGHEKKHNLHFKEPLY